LFLVLGGSGTGGWLALLFFLLVVVLTSLLEGLLLEHVTQSFDVFLVGWVREVVNLLLLLLDEVVQDQTEESETNLHQETL